jgi:predicted site-specific integrase-resolvase
MSVVYDPALLTDLSRRVWTRAEACAALGVSRKALHRITRDARVPYAKRGPGEYLFDAAAILAALAAEARAT